MRREHFSGDLTREIITEIIEQKAKVYTPQWRFDQNHPDLGTALALVYASMQYDTEKSFEKLPEKLRTEFFNMLGAEMKPASPAKGYSVFGLVNDEAEGTELPKGTALTADVLDNSGEAVPVETMEDVFVTPSRIQTVFESYNKKDYIGRLYEREEAEGDGDGAGRFRVFTMEEENLQCHQLLLGHSSVFSIIRGGELELRFYEKKGVPLDNSFMDLLDDRENVIFEYSTAEGFRKFAGQERKEDCISFIKAASQKPWTEEEILGQSQYWLRITVKDGRKLKDLSFREVLASAKAGFLEPDSIYAAGLDGGKGPYFPFGEQFGIYDEVYFSSQEVLCKKGAEVTLSFWREYLKIPLGYTEPREINWKLIMPKSAVKVERDYDITIDRVIWEYFNGSGWVRLFPGREYENLFDGEGGTYKQKRTITFICPKDMSPSLVNGIEDYFIRARVVKVNNSFKTTGQYISPVLSETSFQYRYLDGGVRPEYFIEKNNMKERLIRSEECLGSLYGYDPIKLTEDEKPGLYLGFYKPLNRGPVKILAVTESKNRDRQPRLKWEYLKEGRFQEFHPVDETRNLGQTGLITFNGLLGMERSVLFGQDCYWIRIVDETEAMYSQPEENKPWIKAFYLNGTAVHTVRSGFQEFFTLDQPEGDVRFHLLNQSIYKAQVWVNETGRLSRTERDQLDSEKRLKIIYGEDGAEIEVWVLWEEETESGKKERGYRLDHNQGILEFKDENSRKQPAPGVLNGIQVDYSISAGQAGNFSQGHITGLELTAGFVNKADNPLPLSGGWDRESGAAAMKRHGRQLKHRFQAVTPEDFEKLALASAGSISKAACFTGYGEQGERKPGHVTLVAVQKDFENSSLYFQSLRQTIMEFLKDKASVNLIGGGRFHIVPPVFVEIQVSAQIIVEDFQQIFSCRRKVLERISEFLNPINGNFLEKGWQVGTLPDRNQIDMVLKNAEEVKEVRNLIITGCIRNGQETVEVNPEEMGQCPYVLPVSGAHRITVQAQ